VCGVANDADVDVFLCLPWKDVEQQETGEVISAFSHIIYIYNLEPIWSQSNWRGKVLVRLLGPREVALTFYQVHYKL
jgi:hypothetical protein